MTIYLDARLLEPCGCTVFTTQSARGEWIPTRYRACVEHAPAMQIAARTDWTTGRPVEAIPPIV